MRRETGCQTLFVQERSVFMRTPFFKSVYDTFCLALNDTRATDHGTRIAKANAGLRRKLAATKGGDEKALSPAARAARAQHAHEVAGQRALKVRLVSAVRSVEPTWRCGSHRRRNVALAQSLFCHGGERSSGIGEPSGEFSSAVLRTSQSVPPCFSEALDFAALRAPCPQATKQAAHARRVQARVRKAATRPRIAARHSRAPQHIYRFGHNRNGCECTSF